MSDKLQGIWVESFVSDGTGHGRKLYDHTIW